MYVRNLLQTFLPASSSPPPPLPFLLLGNKIAFFFFPQAGCYHIHGMVNFRLPRKYLGWSKKLQNRMNRNRRSHKRSVSQCEKAGGRKPTQSLLGNSSLAKGGTAGPPGFCREGRGRVTALQEIPMETGAGDAQVAGLWRGDWGPVSIYRSGGPLTACVRTEGPLETDDEWVWAPLCVALPGVS